MPMPIGLGGIAARSRSFGLARKVKTSSAPPPPALPSITENFTGSAGALAGKTTTTGNKTWTTGTGTGVFSLTGSGTANRSDATSDARIWVNTGFANFQKVTLTINGAVQTGIFGRGKDQDHYWIFYNNGDFTGLAYQVGAGFQFIRQQTDTLVTLPTAITFMLKEPHINCWQGNQLILVEDMATDGSNTMYTTYAGGTLAGLFSENTSGTFDDFAVVDEQSVKQVFFIGDSLTFADNLPQQHGSSVNGFPWQAANLLGPQIFYNNFGVNGATIADMDTVQRPKAVAAYLSTFAKNIAVVEGGINDLIAGASAATIESRLTTIWGNLETAGIKVIPYTITPFQAGATETTRQTVNTWIRANAPHGVVADVGANGTGLGSPGDQNNATNYQADLIHYTVAGAAIAAAIVKTAILAV